VASGLWLLLLRVLLLRVVVVVLAWEMWSRVQHAPRVGAAQRQ